MKFGHAIAATVLFVCHAFLLMPMMYNAGLHDTQRPQWYQFLLRGVLKTVEWWFGSMFALVFASTVFYRNTRTPHDALSRTMVVCIR
eukprot:m.33697 g.33697  ORF g.33697 m.33697 type:complete len:87 (+) comp14251_c0_seq3:348-608(+)